MSNTMINVDIETHALLKQLAYKTRRPMRELTAEALRAFSAQTLTATSEKTLVDTFLTRIEKEITARILTSIADDLKKMISTVVEDLYKEQQYKPWLKRNDTDDITEINELT